MPARCGGRHAADPRRRRARLGISRTTVSNAYNRPDQLSPPLRERVLAAARELGYGGPDPMARSLRRGERAVTLLTEGGNAVVLPTELVVRASTGPVPS